MNQRIKLTKRLLKEALLSILKKKTIFQVGISELCETAGINRSTFYAHYSTPHDVLLEIEMDMVSELKELLSAEMSLTSKQKLASICRYLYAHSDTQKILIRNNTDSDLSKVFSDKKMSVLEPEHYFQKIPGNNSTDRQLINAFINYGIYHIIRYWLLNDIKKTPDEIADLISNILTQRL